MAPCWLTAALLLSVSSPALGEEREPLKACAPYTIDGTQIFEPFQANGKCLGRTAKAKMARITDLKLQVICSVPGFNCVHVSSMNQVQRAHYDKLVALNLPGKPHPECSMRAQDGSWELEMLTETFNEDVRCHPVNHGARFYDRVMGIACVMWDGASLGCVPYHAPGS